MTRGEKAEALFLEGYNCPQSVVLAFADKLPMDAETAARLVSAFGGGMSRMREVCGAASGMLFVLGALEGYANPADTDGKTALYTHGQRFMRNEFNDPKIIVVVGAPGDKGVSRRPGFSESLLHTQIKHF